MITTLQDAREQTYTSLVPFFSSFLKSEDSDEGTEWRETGSESSREQVGLQYLYIQMEYCEKSTLRNLIDEGLHGDKERVWRLFREIVEDLVHIHTQVMHKRLVCLDVIYLDFLKLEQRSINCPL